MTQTKKRILQSIIICYVVGLAGAQTIEGKVVGIFDGDTLTVLDAGRKQYKIRLSGIDAPEKAQPFGRRSKEN